MEPSMKSREKSRTKKNKYSSTLTINAKYIPPHESFQTDGHHQH